MNSTAVPAPNPPAAKRKRISPAWWVAFMLVTFVASCIHAVTYVDPKATFVGLFPDVKTDYEIEKFWCSTGHDSTFLWRIKIKDRAAFLSQLRGFEERADEVPFFSYDLKWWPGPEDRKRMRAYYRQPGYYQIIWYDPVADRYYFAWYDM